MTASRTNRIDDDKYIYESINMYLHVFAVFIQVQVSIQYIIVSIVSQKIFKKIKDSKFKMFNRDMFWMEIWHLKEASKGQYQWK